MSGYEIFGRFSDGVRKLEEKFGWAMNFLERKIFPSALVPGINNDQFLTGIYCRPTNVTQICHINLHFNLKIKSHLQYNRV